MRAVLAKRSSESSLVDEDTLAASSKSTSSSSAAAGAGEPGRDGGSGMLAAWVASLWALWWLCAERTLAARMLTSDGAREGICEGETNDDATEVDEAEEATGEATGEALCAVMKESAAGDDAREA